MSTRLRSTMLGVALLGAGALHLWLTGEHMRESALLGWGFIVAGAAQIALGVLSFRIGRAPTRWIIALNSLLIFLYAAHVVTGLPLPDTADVEGSARGVFGQRETIDAPAIVTKIVELAGIVLAAADRRAKTRYSEEAKLSRAA